MGKEQLVLVSGCCGKGNFQAKKLQLKLKEKGMDVELSRVKPRNCERLLNRYGVEISTQNAFIYINDLLIPTDNLNDNFIENLSEQLKQSFLSKIIKK